MMNDRRRRKMSVLLFGFGALLLGVASFLPAAAGEIPARPDGAVMVPDQFLRRWDPVTFFFPKEMGQAAGAERDPSRFVTVTPEHPGAYTWLDGRTLQFRPAEPWPPLTRFRWRFAGRQHELTTLMSAPVETLPADGATDLQPVETLTLTFAEPVEAAALARMLDIELRPLPGVDADRSTRLSRKDYDIKVLERSSRADRARYVVAFRRPIPGGTHVTVHLRLSLDDRADESFHDIRFATAAPFALTRIGCGNQGYPLTEAGMTYGREQALACSGTRRSVDLTFSARPAVIDPVQARNLVRFTPKIEGLEYATAGNSLSVTGQFQDNTLYRVGIEPTSIEDETGRPIRLQGQSEAYLYFPARPDFLRWDASQGIVERFGPQMVPLEGRGFQRLDLRIHKIDPLNRSFWPFPDQAVMVDESIRPPGPGERPEPYASVGSNISYGELQQQLSALGSPSVSTLVGLPLRKNGGRAKFGLDLEPQLEKISGKASPGTYLVGMRQLGKENQRAWIRLQVTDLTLSAVEEVDRVRFLVSSLDTGAPVSGAKITIEGSRRNSWLSLGSGTTDAKGQFDWPAPGYDRLLGAGTIRRIVVEKGDDVLVLDPSRAPEKFVNNHWTKERDTWLQWTQGNIAPRRPSVQRLSHIFTERPVYKPEDPVYIKGYLRTVKDGTLRAVGGKGTLVVNGPGDMEWRYDVALSGAGSFFHKFAEEKLPTGEYSAHFENGDGQWGSVTFRKEAYRLPRFKVDLNGPSQAALDRSFKILMDAVYYAGGPVSGRPVRWRITQFPYNWNPKERPGFAYATDARYSGGGVFRSTPVLEKETVSDEQGMAELEVDPTIEPTAQPRRYVIESTVTGADDQTVTSTHEVKVLPAFTLAMKLPRYLPQATSITPEIFVADADGKLLSGRQIELRLLHRQWHSHLQASDFTDGEARYVTEVVDDLVSTTTLVSASQPLAPSLAIDEAGVYVVEISARDQIGRSQVLSLDLFAGGTQPVTWSRPPTQVFTVTSDKKSYAPGETARLILESPFQKAGVLVAVEEPTGNNRYQWLPVKNGTATLELPVRKEYLPRIPVHFLLMRGRVDGGKAGPGTLDLGKPATLATTTWVEVTPRDNTVELDLDYPTKAQPGDEIAVEIDLHDADGHPLSGEVTLWLVDQAVLALGKEQRLDPLPDFIREPESLVEMRDTRNLTLGRLPFQEEPGGDGGEAEKSALLDNVTIRKNFSPVPFYDPAIMVDAGGKTTVRIKLPDNLTNFKLRAKAVSGADRFGYAGGMLAVRLPVIVQPSLPRFVRPGDAFTATAIGRVVEGPAGEGQASIRTEGLEVAGAAQQRFDWETERPRRIDFPVSVPTPAIKADGTPEREEVAITLGVERGADKARDAFSVKLPLRPDRRPVLRQQLTELKPGADFTLPGVDEPVRPGSLQRSLLLSDQPALVRMAAGLSYLMHYPFGCTEQRLSRSRVMLASKKLDEMLGQKTDESERERTVRQTLQWLEGAVGDDGLAGYWPGSTGYVCLTAWSVQFMVEARQAGFPVDEALLEKMTRALRQSLRSDYHRFIDGAAYAERVWALAALASAGRLDEGYAAELARRSADFDLETTAQLTRVLAGSGSAERQTLDRLTSRLWGGIVLRLYQGREIYGGLQSKAEAAPAQILPSETRTLSEVLRAVAAAGNADPARQQLLVDALGTLGQGDGWGSTNANAAALLALAEFLARGDGHAPQTVILEEEGKRDTLEVGGTVPLASVHRATTRPLKLSLAAGSGRSPLSVRSETRYLPDASGSQEAALAQGFVLSRELLRIARDADAPPEHLQLKEPGQSLDFAVGEMVEDHVELVNPEDRHYVAVVVPLAAGMEPLNPALETAPPEATPQGQLTLEPSYVAFLDDQVAYYYDSLPKGTYHFYFRTRATIPGRYTQPAPYAEMMYREAVRGNGNGAAIVIRSTDDRPE